MNMEIKIKYLDPNVPKLVHIGGQEKSNWIDVYAARFEIDDNPVWNEMLDDCSLYIEPGHIIRVFLGFAMELPLGYEAHIAPRGSTFRKYGLVQTNSVGVVDSSYCGDTDEWFIPFYSLESGIIARYDRIAQFRIMETMPTVKFKPVDSLVNASRGGYGSTG